MLSRWWPLGELFGSTHRRCKQACVLRCLGEVEGVISRATPGFQAPAGCFHGIQDGEHGR